MRELSLSIMDVCQNSVTAKSTLIKLTLEENLDADRLTVTLEDNGCGMSEEQVKSVIDPFYTTRTTRKVGLGVPLFKMAAEMTGGNFYIDSKIGVGTTMKAIFVPSNIDMTPIGDINSTVLPLITGNTDIEFIYSRSITKDGKNTEFTLDTQEIKSVLGGDVPLNTPDVVVWLKEFLEENTTELQEI